MGIFAVSSNTTTPAPAVAGEHPSTPADDPAAHSYAAGPAPSAADPLAARMATQGLHPAAPSPASTRRGGLPPDEAAYRARHGDAALGLYQAAKAKLAEIERAHAIYERTGKIPPTNIPLSPIEIKSGQLMSLSDRYDAMMKAAAQNGTTVDRIAPTYMTAQEFTDEIGRRAEVAAGSDKLATTSGSRGFFDYALGAVDFVTDCAIPLKAVAKAGIAGEYQDMAVLAASALPLPPAVKLGIVDGEVDLVKATVGQVKDAAVGPIVQGAERLNELRKGNVAGAFPEVAAAAAIPRDIAAGAVKIAQGEVREGVRVATPAVLTVAGVAEAKVARPKTGAAAAGADAPKPLAPGAAAESPAAAAQPVSVRAQTLDSVDPNLSHRRADARQNLMEAQRQAQDAMVRQRKADAAAAHYQRDVVPTLPPPLEPITPGAAADGIQRKGWNFNIEFSSADVQVRFNKSGGTGQAPAIFRRGDAVVVDWRRLTEEQRMQIHKAAEARIGQGHGVFVADPTADGRSNTQPISRVDR